MDIDESYSDGEYKVAISNLVPCPMRFILASSNAEVNIKLEALSPLLLEASTDTVITINEHGDLSGKVNFLVKWGGPALPVEASTIESLPYPKGERYKLLQGNNSNPTHNTRGSRYAFDFTLEIGDTITSAQDGYVVGVIDGYKGWGMGDKWKSYGNLVMIYHTTTHLFTMYGHLKQCGRLVEAGDYVKIGQPIALSGKTGQTTEAHLHFNVMHADDGKGGLKSSPLDSIGNYNVKELKRRQWITH